MLRSFGERRAHKFLMNTTGLYLMDFAYHQFCDPRFSHKTVSRDYEDRKDAANYALNKNIDRRINPY